MHTTRTHILAPLLIPISRANPVPNLALKRALVPPRTQLRALGLDRGQKPLLKESPDHVQRLPRIGLTLVLQTPLVHVAHLPLLAVVVLWVLSRVKHHLPALTLFL